MLGASASLLDKPCVSRTINLMISSQRRLVGRLLPHSASACECIGQIAGLFRSAVSAMLTTESVALSTKRGTGRVNNFVPDDLD